MSEPNAPNPQQEHRQPATFAEQVEERLRDIGMRGAEPWNDPVEKRRATRRRDMEILRLAAMEASLHVSEYICGRLPVEKHYALEHVDNPVAALANLNRSIVQLTLAEDRFDESSAERAARIAAEAEAKLKAEAAAEAERVQARKAETKRQVHKTVRAITLSTLKLPFFDREKLVRDLLAELDEIGAYDGEPEDIIADLCVRLGTEKQDPAKHAAAHQARKAPMIALARAHLAALRPTEAANDSFTASVKAQGPPH
jgi:hypothetical protein